MSRDLSGHPAGLPPTILLAPLTRRTWSEVGYALIGLPLGVAGFAVTVAMLSFGLGNSFLLIGLPLIAAGSIVARWFGAARPGRGAPPARHAGGRARPAPGPAGVPRAGSAPS